jgi:hypothetical protein
VRFSWFLFFFFSFLYTSINLLDRFFCFFPLSLGLFSLFSLFLCFYCSNYIMMESVHSHSEVKSSLYQVLYLRYTKYIEKDTSLYYQFDKLFSKKYFRYHLQKSEYIPVSTSITMFLYTNWTRSLCLWLILGTSFWSIRES